MKYNKIIENRTVHTAILNESALKRILTEEFRKFLNLKHENFTLNLTFESKERIGTSGYEQFVKLVLIEQNTEPVR